MGHDARTTTLPTRRARPGCPPRRSVCDAHQGIVPAVATINLSGSGAPMTISVCAHHLAVFEEQFGGWGGAQ